MVRIASLFVALSLVWSLKTVAQTIQYDYRGSTSTPQSSGSNLNISVGTVTGVEVLRIYSSLSAGLPNADIGKITVTGTIASSGGELRVLISGTNVWPVTPDSATAFTVPGTRDLGTTVPGANGVVITDSALRARTRLAAYTSGDIRGDISVGQVQRILAGGLNPEALTGTISANITAIALDDAFPQSTPVSIPSPTSIGFVGAGNAISGTLTAQGDASSTVGASITVVEVGPSSSAGGITGSILAPLGSIEEVWCTGKIGTDAAHLSHIQAGKHIGRISIRDINNPGDGGENGLAANIHATIDQPLSAGYDADYGTSMALIETGGDFHGSLHFYNVEGIANADFSHPLPNRHGRLGIFVGGDFYGDITTDFDWAHADMIARSFRGTIKVGQMLEGAVVAVGRIGGGDELDGTIAEIDVGNNGLAAQGPPAPPPDSFPPLPVNGHGFNAIAVGNLFPPFEGASRDVWYTANAAETSSLDSVIRAERAIGQVRIRSMASNLYGQGQQKQFRPRIESPAINKLEITAFESGVVWSGKLGNSLPDTDIADDYASIAELSIGCMGPRADLWVGNCPAINIIGDMFGDIRLNELAPDEVVRVGRLGSRDQIDPVNPPPTCSNEDLPYTLFGIPYELSPRGFWPDVENSHGDRPSGAVEWSSIFVRQPFGLRGQVIIDPSNTTGSPRPDHWRGDVEVGTGVSGPSAEPGDAYVITTDATDQFHTGRGVNTARPHAIPVYAHNALGKPAYALTNALLGGGSVGQVPYELHLQDCIPAGECPYPNGCNRGDNENLPVPIISSGDFINHGVRLSFYGPVTLAGTASPHIHMYQCNSFGIPDPTTDYAPMLAVNIQPMASSPFSRVVVVKWNGASPPSAGRYILQRAEDGLRCDAISVSAQVDTFNYNFIVDSAGGDQQYFCRNDFDGDGDVGTDQDIEAFFRCLAGNCCATCGTADFNGDGDIGTDGDIESFFRVLAGGPC